MRCRRGLPIMMTPSTRVQRAGQRLTPTSTLALACSCATPPMPISGALLGSCTCGVAAHIPVLALGTALAELARQSLGSAVKCVAPWVSSVTFCRTGGPTSLPRRRVGVLLGPDEGPRASRSDTRARAVAEVAAEQGLDVAWLGGASDAGWSTRGRRWSEGQSLVELATLLRSLDHAVALDPLHMREAWSGALLVGLDVIPFAEWVAAPVPGEPRLPHGAREAYGAGVTLAAPARCDASVTAAATAGTRRLLNTDGTT